MPIIKVSTQELKKGLPLQPKWYGAAIREIKAEPTKDKSGVNYNVYFMLEDGSTEGREFKHTINEHAKGNLRGIWISALSTAEEAFTIDPNEITSGEYAFDSDDVVGKKLKIKIITEPFNGNLVAKAKDFVPYFVDTDSIPF